VYLHFKFETIDYLRSGLAIGSKGSIDVVTARGTTHQNGKGHMTATASIETQLNNLEDLRLPALQACFKQIVGEATRAPNRTFLIRKIREAAAAPSAVEVTQGEESTELGSEAKPTILTGPLGPITVRTSKAKKTAQAKKPRKPRKAPIRVAQVEAPQVADAPAPELTVSDTSTAETSVLDVPAPLNLKTLSVDDLRKAYVEEVGRPTKSTDRNYLIWKIRMARKGKVPVGPIHRTRSENHGALKVLPLRMPEATVEALDDVWRRHSLSSRMEMFRCALHQYLTSLEEHEAAALIHG